MIKFLDIKKITDSFQPRLGEAVASVVDSGYFVRGEGVKLFEGAYAAYTGTRYCVGVGNGFDALRLIMKAWILMGRLKEGDEVIVPSNTYIASILAVTENRLRPVWVEPRMDTMNVPPEKIIEKITARTRVVMVVHLYGRNAMCAGLKDLAEKYDLMILEDNAQAAGCCWGERRTGALGNAGAHSFFPTKNLGALGDGGAVTTDDPGLADLVQTLGNYGSAGRGLNRLQGVNSRLDEIQAAVLTVKLPALDPDNAYRRRLAHLYLDNIHHPDIVLPAPPTLASEHVWHLFVIRTPRRDELQEYLLKKGIETLVHYPVPPHKQQAFLTMNQMRFPVAEQIHREVLSLPLNPGLEESEIHRVIDAVNNF